MDLQLKPRNALSGSPEIDLTDAELDDLFDFSDDDFLDEEDTNDGKKEPAVNPSFQFSKYSEDEHVMDEDDVDLSNLKVNASGFTYENNAKMEIGTMRTAIDRDRAELHLIRDSVLVVQGHWEVIVAKRTLFKNAVRSSKIDQKLFNDLMDLVLKLEFHLAELSISKTIDRIRHEIKTLVPQQRQIMRVRRVTVGGADHAQAMHSIQKRASLSQFSYTEMQDFSDKLSKLWESVHNSKLKAQEFFHLCFEQNTQLMDLFDTIRQKEDMLKKKCDTMNKVMFSRFMNEWKRKAFVKKNTTDLTTKDDASNLKRLSSSAESLPIDGKIMRSLSSITIKDPSNTTINIDHPTGSITIVEPVNTTINIVDPKDKSKIQVTTISKQEAAVPKQAKVVPVVEKKPEESPKAAPSEQKSTAPSNRSYDKLLTSSNGHSTHPALTKSASSPSPANPALAAHALSRKSTAYSYQELKTNKDLPIDQKGKEAYLKEDEFVKVFKMDRKKFYEQKKWKQDELKKAAGLF